ncbi:MAG: hypothetical protein LBI71_02220 [Enterobacteriaceae bacterium]|jgi:hypothetical protein|nr:hypothetical protein [Enterobacteriaceae bacterium]
MSKIITEIDSTFTNEIKDSITELFNDSMQDKLSPDELKKQSSELFRKDNRTFKLDAGATLIHIGLFKTGVSIRVEGQEPDVYNKKFKGEGWGVMLGVGGIYLGVIYSNVKTDALYKANKFWAGTVAGALYISLYNDSLKLAHFVAVGVTLISGVCSGSGRFYDI